MNKSLIVWVIAACMASTPLHAQTRITDSLNNVLKLHTREDSTRVNLMNKLSQELMDNQPDSAMFWAEQAERLAHAQEFFHGEAVALIRIGTLNYNKSNYTAALQRYEASRVIAEAHDDVKTSAWALNGMGTVHHSQSNYPQALDFYLKAVQQFEKIGDEVDAASIMGNVGVLYKEMGELSLALDYFKKGVKIHESVHNTDVMPIFLNNIGTIYSEQKKYPEALEVFLRCLDLAHKQGDQYSEALVLRNLVEIRLFQKNYQEALSDAFQSLALYKSLDDQEGIADVYFRIADAYLEMQKPDSALHYGKQSLNLAQKIGFKRNIFNTYQVLAAGYAGRKEYQKAYEAQKLYNIYKDSLTGEENQQRVAGLKFQYDLDKKQSQIALLTKDRQLQAEKALHRSQQVYALIAGLVLLILLAGILISNNRQKRRANEELLLQKDTITLQRDHLEKTIQELRSTQEQLLHKEKMASLGELTAGIAHEIQNPLNFVNNFSELNTELLVEMEQELIAGNNKDALVLAHDVLENGRKIHVHGKRADAIIKGMLQHSQAGSGIKEATPFNTLVEEHVRMSYNGFRVKDKSFLATIKTEYDEHIGLVSMIPQEIGRVILNLCNNAFYAVKEKKKHSVQTYEPIVEITTIKMGSNVEVMIRDNGEGISNKVLDKIFQPFFTTKPTGQGTGLGLSISYDIVSKGHGGMLTAESKEGEFSVFKIVLPFIDEYGQP